MGLDPSWLTIYYVAAGKKVTIPYDASRESELKAFLTRVADIMSHGRSFTPNTEYCGNCDFRNRCGHSTAKDEDCV